MQILYVRDRIHDPARAEDVGVLGAEGGGDDARFVLAGFEVWVGVEEVDAVELVVGEEVGEEFHGVAAQGGDVCVGAWDWVGWWGPSGRGLRVRVSGVVCSVFEGRVGRFGRGGCILRRRCGDWVLVVVAVFWYWNECGGDLLALS